MFTRPKRLTTSIDMAPLIDVVFLLLIFFMLTSSFTAPSLQIKLPTATSRPDSTPEVILVAVDRQGSITLQGAPIQLSQFESKLRALSAGKSDAKIHFRGDQEMNYGLFVELMDRARQIGIVQFNLVHDPKK
ncbi:MAG: biopolymer transporter ExbD [Verrucomicrobia bacterium]|jgi:biopolymer transport protein ExbD|nr:biopolymer transporter ExbD [Verrucomicrobiota bacterium]